MVSTTPIKTPPRDSVLSRFLLGFHGERLSAELAGYLARGLAGVVIYKRNFSSAAHLRELCAEIRRAAGRPVLIGIDQEGGTRFALDAPFTRWPSPAELGRRGDLNYTEQVAHAMAVEIRAAGCNLNFAPMLDLHLNAESPVTRDRSFGADPHRAAQFGAAFHTGLKAGGVLSCAKHFPGHGDTAVDPHQDLPVFYGTMARLESRELIPFYFAASAGMPTMMTAHILLPDIDPENPASLSRFLLHEILRVRLNFRGVILADDLGMGAIAKRYGAGEAAVRALQSGTDIVMLCHDWTAVAPAISAVEIARKYKLFDENEWNASLERIERVCESADTSEPQPPLEIIGCEAHRVLAVR
jgi:beta-N-acetylhexosaminidase